MKFETVIKALEMINKMDIDLEVEFKDVTDYGTKILSQVLKKIPKAQNEFIELVNDVCETEYTKESDIFEMLPTIKGKMLDLAKVFQSALKLKDTI